MSKILAIFGATGHQGSSVLHYVLNDPELFQTYKIRAITRDLNTSKAQQLSQKVEVVAADFQDLSSIETALTGAHSIFLMTPPSFGPNALDDEYNNVKLVADIAVHRGVDYLIFSTLPGIRAMSHGKYTKVTPFDAKAEAEAYIRTLPIKSAFYCPAGFMENFQSQPFLNPRPAADGTWVLSRCAGPTTRFPWISAVADSGKVVGAILAEPGKYEGKTFCAAGGLYSMVEMAEALSKASGKKVVYRQILAEELRGFFPLPGLADMFIEGFEFYETVGYFGPGTEELVAWSRENTRGELTSFEGFLERNVVEF
ncbi:NAD(P)-binding protein [Aspergillus ellipticus CBS 707.79]|uniref:NAD(P)-binding protein n=1 Tax=Aspergillus ellipticus CBS 707.79 TaxID=1448320 RepID=A0A319D2T1_9EURO|nr:NAD(P)-binding protein [Aspergillus ellipticus CBS 707.79]